TSDRHRSAKSDFVETCVDARAAVGDRDRAPAKSSMTGCVTWNQSLTPISEPTLVAMSLKLVRTIRREKTSTDAVFTGLHGIQGIELAFERGLRRYKR
ncbi:MAG: hypothetical protein ACXW14_03495, partial [Burkholderiaceae bacterium]